MTADLAGFLLAQLDADAAVAREIAERVGSSEWRDGGDGDEVTTHPAGYMVADCWDGASAHIALHDPTFELDRIAALRTVVELHAGEWRDVGDAGDAYLACIECDRFGWPCPTLLALAQPYRGRDGWRDEWGTG